MSQVLTDDRFETEIAQSQGLSLVDLWAEWCGPCKILGPTVDAIARDYAGKVKVFKLDVDANPQTPARFHIRGVPTLLIFKDGQLVDQLIGAHSRQTIVSTLEKHQGA